MKHNRYRVRGLLAWCAAAVLVGQSGQALAQYDAPSNYYSTATGTGATLKTQLRTITTTGMTGVNYGNARYMLAITDRDPNNPNNVLRIYDRASVSGAWDGNTSSPWHREHIWPQSLLGASASNGTVNIASDLFNLRPILPSINSSRSNSPFGTATSSGSYGYSGSYWYPGNADAGDVARSQFYMATRYSQLSLVNGLPSGLQMGDLASMVKWHFKDTPDDFERRRNHAIYGLAGENSPAIASDSNYKQRNRNPYVDRPEYVWSVFVDQENDSRLSVGTSPTANANGASSADVNLGRVIVGAAVPSAQNVTLHKQGVDGTYYSVTTSGAATSTVTGRYNAFEVGTTGSRQIGVGLNASTASAGLKSGAVTIDNLDVTTQGGAGRGANDANDIININLSVLDHSNASFSSVFDQNELVIDFGTVTQNAYAAGGFDIFNLESLTGFTAALDLTGINSFGDTSLFSTDLTTFANLAAGASYGFTTLFDTQSIGLFSATYQLSVFDENIAGRLAGDLLTLQFVGEVVAVPEPGSLIAIAAAGFVLLRRRHRA